MQKCNERRARSLDDISEVVKLRNNKIRSIELKISKKRSEKKTCNYEELGRSKRYALVLLKIDDERSQDDSSDSEEDKPKEDVSEKSTTTVDIKETFENNSKINPLDAPNFVHALAKEGDCDSTRGHKQKKRIWSLIDVLLSMVLITPLTVGFWRGIWGLMDLHNDRFPGIICFVLGGVVHAGFAIFKNYLHAHVSGAWRKKNWANNGFSKIAQISYTYVFGVACNAQWRGGWMIFDHFFGGHIWITVGTLLAIIGILAALRSVRNLLAVPSVVFIDKLTYVFYFPTRYNSNTRDWSLYLLDCAFSVGVVGTLVVFVWRGVWILFDLYLFPDDREYSAIGSLAIGYAIVTVTFSLQPLMRYVCARLQGLARLIAADGFLLLSFLGTVNVWRGAWNVLDLWLVPDNPELSCWITHVGCFVFLVLLNCSNSILVRGVYIDAEEDDGKCVVFPCHYLRLFFKVEREKKEARRRNLLVASKDFRPRADGNAKDTENGALLPNSTAATTLPANPESLV